MNLEYLEGKLESLDGEELMKIKDNINCLFQHCIQALGEEHPIRVVNALQVQGWETGKIFLIGERNCNTFLKLEEPRIAFSLRFSFFFLS